MKDMLSFVWFLLVILPIQIGIKAWAIFKAFMARNNLWVHFPYFLLAFLIILLLVLLASGYR